MLRRRDARRSCQGAPSTACNVQPSQEIRDPFACHDMPKNPLQKNPLQLGRPIVTPASPEEAVLDRVPNKHPDADFVARFTFPEFTAMCPVTGQPDFATLVIDYVPRSFL